MMRKYAIDQGSQLLSKLVHQLHQAAATRDADAVHDLRVAIRRFQQFLRVFRQFLPRTKVKKIRRRLRGLMILAGEVRNRDIASMLLQQAGVTHNSQLSATLARDREQAQQELLRSIDRLNRRGLAKKWHSRLRL
jgi:CHAD domain-containing protein